MEIRLRSLRYPALAMVVVAILIIGAASLPGQAPRLTAEEHKATTSRPLLETNAFPTWTAFTPLIQPTEAGWQSQCVTLSPA